MPEPTPLLRVTGAPVLARAGDEIGKVKEIRWGAFEVEPGLQKPDYWLSGEAVASAGPDEAVAVTAPKSEIDSFKVDGPSQAA